jgi:hypothetical protein
MSLDLDQLMEVCLGTVAISPSDVTFSKREKNCCQGHGLQHPQNHYRDLVEGLPHGQYTSGLVVPQ